MATPKNQNFVNRSTPGMNRAKVGDVVADLIVAVNAQSVQLAAVTAKHNALLTKMDADAGITDTNYASTTNAPAFSSASVPDLESR